MKVYFFALLLFSSQAAAADSQETCARKVDAYLKISESQLAVQEARQALLLYPDALMLKRALIRALAKAGCERECFAAWKLYGPSFTDSRQKMEVIEEMAWGVLEKEFRSSSLSLRGTAMLCAAMTQDVYAVDFLVKGLRDSNALLREVAVELAALFNDRPLQLEVLRLLECETVWDVRLEAIAAAGQMQLWEAVPKLTKILSNDRVPMEERGLAAASIVELRDGVQRSELIALVRSNCAGLRVLACKLVTEFDRVDDLDLIAPLLCDGRTEVRLEALNTIGVLRVQSIGGKSVEELVSSYTRLGDYKVAITAAWVMVLCGGDAEAFFTPWINHANAEVRLFAAAVLAACGRYGETAAQKILEKHTDPFVRVNLAIGLLGQRVAVEQSCDELYTFLMMQQKPLAWSSRANSLFSALAPSHLKRSQSLSKTPEAADMAVRLDLLRLLAMMGYPKTQEAVKRFLREKMWGISGIAAETLIEEGDQAAVDIVRNLLEDEDPTVRVQAALVLALWSREERAICVLQDAYPGAARELKTKILEALGRIGAAQSVPFLIEVLQDPFPVLRAVAASALITCLNH